MKNEKSEIIADSNKTLNRWENYFSQLLNSHEISDVKQTGILIYVPFLSESTPFESDIATDKLKIYKFLIINEIQAELI
jgi:hypothetical protein